MSDRDRSQGRSYAGSAAQEAESPGASMQDLSGIDGQERYGST